MPKNRPGLFFGLDALLMAAPRWLRLATLGVTLVHMIAVALPNVPRAYVDYDRWPILDSVSQPDSYGTDTIADMYAAKVVLNDPADMYTRERLPQTPEEAATWTRRESAPYPPVALLAAAGLYATGDAIGIGYYGAVLLLAAIFIGLSVWCFARERWYVFPLLYLNFSFVAYRFVYVQDGSYLAMLVVIMSALVLARRHPDVSHLLMAVAATMKLSSIAHAWEAFTMRRAVAVVWAAVIVGGLVAPYFVWNDYLYIYTFHDQIKGNVLDTLAAVVVVVPFSLILRYIEVRLAFDLEDRIGWAVIPFGMLLAIKMRAPRHLLLMLLIPDKRVARNVIAAIELALMALGPSVFRSGSVLYSTVALLCITLGGYLHQIGWDQVRLDVRQWRDTIRMLLFDDRAGARAAANT